jgi:hypothetical protein
VTWGDKKVQKLAQFEVLVPVKITVVVTLTVNFAEVDLEG